MSIQKINFNSSLIRNNIIVNKQDITEQNPNKNQSAEQAQATEQPQQVEETEPQETAVADAPEKKSHTAKNLTLVGATLALVTLGVMGRRGKLGPRFQKLLGGAEKATKMDKIESKNADDFVDNINPEKIQKEPPVANTKNKVGEVVEEQATPVAENAEQAAASAGNKVEEVVEEQITPVAENAEQAVANAGNEVEVKAKAPKPADPPTSIYDAVSESGEILSKAEREAINRTLDRTLPKIEKKMLSVKAPTIEEIEEMGFDLTKFELKGKPNSSIEKRIGDKKYFIHYNKDGNLNQISQGEIDTKCALDCSNCIKVSSEEGKIYSYISGKNTKFYTTYRYNADGSLYDATIKQGNNIYLYNEEGLFKELKIEDEGKVLKIISYVPGKDEPVEVIYGPWYDSPETKKIEKFTGIDGYPVKEIYVKNGIRYYTYD